MTLSHPPRTGALLALAVATLGGALAAPAYAATPTCVGRPATIVGTSASERIVGTSGPDVIVAYQGDDVISGAGGDDVICAGDGADLVRGGPGADALYGQRDQLSVDRGGVNLFGDTLVGGGGDDTLSPGSDPRYADASDLYRYDDLVSYDDSSSAVRVDLPAGTADGATSGHDTLVGPVGGVHGSAYDDTILGTDRDEVLTAFGGSDTILAAGGDDLLYADPDEPDGRPADDRLEGGDGDDELTGADGDDVLDGQAGDDRVLSYAATGAPSVIGGDGADALFVGVPGTSGFEVTGDADDLLLALDSRVRPAGTSMRVDTTAGTLSVGGTTAGTLSGVFPEVSLGERVRWTFAGAAYAERVELTGGYPALVNGQGGDDTVYGGGGADALYGGPGADYTAGGAGSDLCRAERKAGCER